MSEATSLVRLMIWLSPAFPVGAFTYSHGLEWAVEDGTVTTAAALTAWLSDILRHGAGRSDAILLALGVAFTAHRGRAGANGRGRRADARSDRRTTCHHQSYHGHGAACL